MFIKVYSAYISLQYDMPIVKKFIVQQNKLFTNSMQVKWKQFLTREQWGLKRGSVVWDYGKKYAQSKLCNFIKNILELEDGEKCCEMLSSGSNMSSMVAWMKLVPISS